MELFFDTETTGLANFKGLPSDKNQPDIIQIGAVLSDKDKVYAKLSTLVNPADVHEGWNITKETEAIHGISNEMVKAAGIKTHTMLVLLEQLALRADRFVCHNVNFDKLMLLIALHRADYKEKILFQKKPTYCTMENSTDMCKLPGKFPGKYKWPKLVELHQHLFNETFEGAHDALVDVMATRRCYYKLTEEKKNG